MIKLVLTSDEILEKVFKGSTPGYDALEVDEYLDKIIKDYKTVESNCLMLEKEVRDLKKNNEQLLKDNKALVIENEKLSARFSDIKVSDGVTSENMELIKRINALEKFIYEHHLDPTLIK